MLVAPPGTTHESETNLLLEATQGGARRPIAIKGSIHTGKRRLVLSATIQGPETPIAVKVAQHTPTLQKLMEEAQRHRRLQHVAKVGSAVIGFRGLVLREMRDAKSNAPEYVGFAIDRFPYTLEGFAGGASQAQLTYAFDWLGKRLKEIHQAGVVVGDLSAKNVLVRPTGHGLEIKLADLETGRVTHPPPSWCRAGGPVRSPHDVRKTEGQACDVWALGRIVRPILHALPEAYTTFVAELNQLEENQQATAAKPDTLLRSLDKLVALRFGFRDRPRHELSSLSEGGAASVEPDEANHARQDTSPAPSETRVGGRVAVGVLTTCVVLVGVLAFAAAGARNLSGFIRAAPASNTHSLGDTLSAREVANFNCGGDGPVEVENRQQRAQDALVIRVEDELQNAEILARRAIMPGQILKIDIDRGNVNPSGHQSSLKAALVVLMATRPFPKKIPNSRDLPWQAALAELARLIAAPSASNNYRMAVADCRGAQSIARPGRPLLTAS